jgi:hypothetical protein
MLTTYLKTPAALVRYRSSPAGPHLDRFVGWLETQGYQPLDNDLERILFPDSLLQGIIAFHFAGDRLFHHL